MGTLLVQQMMLTCIQEVKEASFAVSSLPKADKIYREGSTKQEYMVTLQRWYNNSIEFSTALPQNQLPR